MAGHGTNLPAKTKGIDPNDTLKAEKGEAITATRQLLCAKPESVRSSFTNRLNQAKTSREISRILAEVRDIL